MKINLQELMDRLNVNAAQFAETIGVQRSSISHFLSGRNNPSLDVLRKILMAYPNINAEWLISGEGIMMKNKVPQKEVHEQAPPSKENDLFSTLKDEDPVPYGIINQKEMTGSDNDGEKTALTKDEKIKKEEISMPTIERVLIFYDNGTFKEYLPQ